MYFGGDFFIFIVLYSSMINAPSTASHLVLWSIFSSVGN